MDNRSSNKGIPDFGEFVPGADLEEAHKLRTPPAPAAAPAPAAPRADVKTDIPGADFFGAYDPYAQNESSKSKKPETLPKKKQKKTPAAPPVDTYPHGDVLFGAYDPSAQNEASKPKKPETLPKKKQKKTPAAPPMDADPHGDALFGAYDPYAPTVPEPPAKPEPPAPKKPPEQAVVLEAILAAAKAASQASDTAAPIEDAPLSAPKDADAANGTSAPEPLERPESPDEPADDGEHRILGAQDDSELESFELESKFIRRVAAKQSFQDGSSARPDDAADQESSPKKPRSSPLMDALRGPFVRYMATRAAKRELREQEAASWPAPVDIRETDELSPAKAARYYSAQLRPLRSRILIAVLLSLILAWIAFSFPMSGRLGTSLAVRAAVSLIMLLTVMLTALEVVTDGVKQLLKLRMSTEALTVAACIVACFDSVLALLGLTPRLPYSAVAAVSLTTALIGEYLTSFGFSVSFRTASSAKRASALSAGQGGAKDLSTLICAPRDDVRIVRRSEEPDGSRSAYAVAAPVLLLLSLGLAVASTIGGAWIGFLHTLSGYLSVCAAFTSFLCFALPCAVAAVRLHAAGAALAGYPGCADIGRTHRVIVTDTDMFPTGTIRLVKADIPENTLQEKVISYTVSLLKASGSSVAAAFDEMMNYRHYPILKVDDFKCHDGGGLSAYIHNENVLVGSSGFINLMGIRIPRDLDADNAICVAISGELVGILTMTYVPLKGVRDALDLLLAGRVQPVFAIRDFNITPLMIQKLFRLPSINFEFPSFRERYRLSSAFAADETPPAAVLAGRSLKSSVLTAECGRKLYRSCAINTAVSLLGSVLGMALIFFLGRSGMTNVATASRLLGYHLLWTLPVLGSAAWVYL